MANTIDILGDEQTSTLLISRAITTFEDDVLTDIGSYAFRGCSALTSVNLPVATHIDTYAFSQCSALTSVNLPVATNIDTYAFNQCTALTSVNLPVATNIGSYAFSNCSNLTSVDFPVATNIGSYAFRGCSQLTIVILRNTNQVATLSNTNAFINASSAIIYVPDALVDSYKAAQNWSTYASRIKGLSELPT